MGSLNFQSKRGLCIKHKSRSARVCCRANTIFALFCLAALVFAGEAQGYGRRIIGGKKAQEGQFPYVALLYYGDEAYCGATIFHKRWALKAAHCIQHDKTDPKILVGTVKKAGNTYYRAETLIRHGALIFLSEFVINDIGLIRLDRDIDNFSFRIRQGDSGGPLVLYDCRLGGRANLFKSWIQDQLTPYGDQLYSFEQYLADNCYLRHPGVCIHTYRVNS